MGGSRSGKSNALLSLVTRLWLYVFDKIYLYVKYPNEAKYEYPIKNVENDLENLQNTKAVIIYSNNMQDVYKNIEEYNPDRECKVLIAWWYDYLCD